MKHMGWGMPPGDPQSASLDVSHHKEQEYICERFLRYKFCQNICNGLVVNAIIQFSPFEVYGNLSCHGTQTI